MSPNKVGICTLYYHNRNYGANLQSYALWNLVESFGYHAELIQYFNFTKTHHRLVKLKGRMQKNTQVLRNIAVRDEAIARFRDAIPHSELYYSNTIRRANRNYDRFITGSDQVWNPDWINPFMSLEFTDASKPTVAYAASVGKSTLDPQQQQKLRIALEHTDLISVREKESIPALQALTDKPIEFALDPTLLLTVDRWNEICSERKIKEDYLFCYFLGGNEHLRKVACEFAKENDLKIVTLPYLYGVYRKVDDGFGDHALYDVSPRDFLSLIRYASFVLTDSFHTSVFAHLYERKFAVTGNGKDQMGCRMLSLTELFGTKERYFPTPESLTAQRLAALAGACEAQKKEEYESVKQRSLDFLERALKQ